MNQDTFRARILEISERVVLVDLTNLSALGEIHGQLEELQDEAPGDVEKELVSFCMDRLSEAILGDHAEDALAKVGKRLTEWVEAGEEEEEPDSSTGAGGGDDHLEPIRREFLANQISVLEDIEALIMAIERGDGEDSGAALLRAFHTMKGESALLGLDSETVCHQVEEMLEQLPVLSVTETLLAAVDWLGSFFACERGDGPAPDSHESLLQRIDAEIEGESTDTTSAGGSTGSTASGSLASGADEDSMFADTKSGAAADETETPAVSAGSSGADASAGTPTAASTASGSGGTGSNTSAAATAAASASEKPVTPISLADVDRELLNEFIQEGKDHLEDAEQHLLAMESDPHCKESVNALFRAIHTIKGVAGMLGLNHVQDLSHVGETLLDKARHGELILVGERIEAIFQMVDVLKHELADLVEAKESVMPRPESAGLIARLEILCTQESTGGTGGSMDHESSASNSGTSSTPTPTPYSTETSVAKASGEGAQNAPSQSSSNTASRKKSKELIKIDAERFDRMVDMIGELVIAESMVSGSKELKAVSSPELSRDLGLLNKIIRELQETGTSLRMIPVRSTFQKMARVVRDIAKKTGKSIQFTMEGEDTELDKSVVDKIGDPLVHMVRNAVDHGIESAADRLAAGKSEAGNIALKAYHRDGNICVEVVDDGGGINAEKVFRKAVERGIISESSQISEAETLMLVFEPGFSTAEKVTDVSGRGVGMDVVRRNIEALRGRVAIESKIGKGTTFRIQLPLTLAIIDGMVVRVGEDRYIVPTANVVCGYQPTESEVTTVFGRASTALFQGHTLPLFRLKELYGLEQECDDSLILVLEAEGKRIGVVVEELIGHQQIVIKSLGASMGRVAGITGGAVLPDGRIGLIVDVSGLYKLAGGSGQSAEPAEAQAA